MENIAPALVPRQDGTNAPPNNGGGATPAGNDGAPTPPGNDGAATPPGNDGAATPPGNGGSSTAPGNGGSSTPPGNGVSSTSTGNGGTSPPADGGSSPTTTSTSSKRTSTAKPKATTAASKSNRNETVVGIQKYQLDSLRQNQCENCLSAGPIAGIAVGVAFVVALIAILATVFITRRRGKPARGRRHSSTEPKSHEARNPKGGANGIVTQAPIDDYLPQAADDKTVRSSVEKIVDQMHLFVENFIEPNASSKTGLSAEKISPLDSSALSQPLATLIMTTRDPIPMLKHALANYMLRRISISSDIEDSLLPLELMVLPHKVHVTKKGARPDAGLSARLSRWRSLTASIRSTTSEPPSDTARRDAVITSSSTTILQALRPYFKSKYTTTDHANGLTMILSELASLGAFLTSQPADLRFQWPSVVEAEHGKLCISPALVKSTDEKGQVLEKAQVVVNARFERAQG